MNRLRLPILLILLLGCLAAHGQTYFNDVPRGIPNDGAWHRFDIPVSGTTSPQLSFAFGLNRVCMVVNHREVSHLTIKLVSPAGNEVLLADLNGQRGANFNNTCFSMRAPRSISNGTAPFTGTYISQQFFSRVNLAGAPANGAWYLAIRNTSPTDTGSFLGVSITLENNPAADPAFVPLCGVNNPGDCHCPDGSDTCDLLPDMTTSAQIIADQHLVSGDSLRFSNATPNIGWGPIEVHGTAQCYCDTARVLCNITACPNGQPPRERVIQRIYRKEGLTMTTRDRDMGFMQYHPSHGHVHVEGWSVYTIRVKNQNPDPLQWPIVATSGKRSYCLVNFGDCDGRFGYCVDDTGGVLTHEKMPNYGFGVVTATTCGRDQGIFVGSLDIYATNTPGQAMSLRGLCTGDYYIVSQTDPDHMVEEMNYGNNVAAVPVHIDRVAGVVPNFDISGSGPSLTFTASNLPAGAQYVWVFGDGVRDSLNNPTVHLYNQPGRYTVRLIYKNQCPGNTSTTQVITIASVPPALSAASFGLRVQPNPATEGAVIAFNLPGGAGGRLFVANSLGQTVRRFEPSVLKMGANAVPIGVVLPRGLYSAVLETKRGRAVVTFAVE